MRVFQIGHQSAGHLNGSQTPGALLLDNVSRLPAELALPSAVALEYGPRGRRGCRPTRSGRQQLPPSESRRPRHVAPAGTTKPAPLDPLPDRSANKAMSSSEDEEDDAYYDLAQPTVTTSRSAASTIILNRLDDLEFSLTGCDYDHTERG